MTFKCPKRTAFKIAATWFGCGYLKPAPGTWGTIGTLPLGILLLWINSAPLLLLVIALISVIGLLSAHRWEQTTGIHDDKRIVIDETAGMLIALIPAALNPLHILIAFIAFRTFDIIKPGPIGWIDKNIHGAMGVMMDDIYAGLLAACLLLGLRYGFGI